MSTTTVEPEAPVTGRFEFPFRHLILDNWAEPELVRAAEIEWQGIGTPRVLGLSAGASAPEIIVEEIIEAFRSRFEVTVDLAITVEETEDFPVVRALRDVELTRADMAFVNG